ncbi:hypothetical protein J4E90_002989 [Alternaria incomplexa]|uniref:uncharacterized protein n=1 Tax=Alternaria incomplexa TaxID=1187928 RepID=UPI002220A25A|nr:uncharacterized protein J4E90_002989 [Alternaria incomplexa]KAI4918603.1 hypothetical protein J4E90_002989 [Alternaria incomplexa]
MTQPPHRPPPKRTVPKVVAPKPPAAPSAKQPAKPKKEKRYPFDSHQDDIVVNTTELDTAPGYRRGLVDYRHKLTLKKTYNHITTDYAEDMKMTIPKDVVTPLGSETVVGGDGDGDDDEDDDDGDDDGDEDEKTNANTNNPKSKRDERTYVPEVSDIVIDYTKLPKPRCNRPNYVEYIYRATTTNPAVFLAILRVAERNLPFINFDSAITHLPNLLANARLPAIPPLSALSPDPSNPSNSSAPSASSNHPQKHKPNQPAFTEDTPHEKKDGDMALTILFLPNLYEDGRHAIGYYALAPEADPDTKQVNPEDVVQILFTPCGISDLVEARLLEWTPIDPDLKARADEKNGKEGDGVKGEDGKGAGEGKEGDTGDAGEEEEELTVEYIEHVAARGGEWLERDVVGDWEEWCRSFRVARRVWEKVLKGVVEVKEVEDVKEEAVG